MSKLSKREQFLLFLLGMILVFVLFYVFVWMPTQTTKLALETEQARLENEKFVMDTTLPLHGKLTKDLETGLDDIDGELSKIENNIDEARFERWMFPVFKDRDITVTQTNFTRSEVASPDASFYVKNDPMYRIKEMINEINDISVVQETKPLTESVLLKSTHEYHFYASFPDFINVLDEITDWNTTFFVNQASYDNDAGIGTIKIDAYTIDKFEVTEDSRYEGHYPADGLNDASDVPAVSGSDSDTNTNTNTNTGFIDTNKNNVDDREEDDYLTTDPGEPNPNEIPSLRPGQNK